MKKALAILLVYSILMTLLVVSPFTANADEKSIAETGDTVASGTTGECTWKIEGTKLTISGNGKMDDYSFYPPWQHFNITEAVIEKGVTSIGNYAFYRCEKLTSVTIPDSVTSISWSAFNYTAWYNNQPDGLVYAGKVAYKMKGTCPSKVVIKDGTLGIAGSAFSNCTRMTSVSIPDSVTNIGSSAFYNTAWYNNQPDGLVYAGKVAYKMKGTCPSEVVIKDGTVNITASAFSDCTGLTSIDIPDSVTSIGSSAFSGCKGLTSVTIPDSVTSIGEAAFADCSNLKKVQVNQAATNIFSKIFSSATTAVENVIISDTVTSIGKSAFSGCSSLKSVTIPESVTSIGSFAFYGCTGLMSVTIPDSVTSIGDEAFAGCSSLTSIDIPDSVTSIGNKAFDGCTGLTSVTLSRFALENFKQIFSIENIESVKISDNVKSISDFAFKDCIKLTSVFIPDSVTSIGEYAFANCIRLTNINIPNSVTSIGESAFNNCIRLTRINIPDSVRSIGYEAFFNCMKLTSVTIPDLVMSIDDCAFGYYYDNSYHGAYDTQKNKLTGFTIYGYYGSQAWRYANNCKFNFIALDDEPSDPTKTTDREIFGDIDGDGIITITDTTYLQRYTIQAETPYPIGEKMK